MVPKHRIQTDDYDAGYQETRLLAKIYRCFSWARSNCQTPRRRNIDKKNIVNKNIRQEGVKEKLKQVKLAIRLPFMVNSREYNKCSLKLLYLLLCYLF